MVIFHSYVSLPEGRFKFGVEATEKGDDGFIRTIKNRGLAVTICTGF